MTAELSLLNVTHNDGANIWMYMVVLHGSTPSSKEAKHLEIMLCDKWSASKLTSVHTNNYNFPQFLNKKVQFAEKEPVLVIVYNTIQ